jgi:hypothetical protein
MFFDDNLTNTKAFKEQLTQHETMLAPWTGSSAQKRKQMAKRILHAFKSIQSWLQVIVNSFSDSKASKN